MSSEAFARATASSAATSRPSRALGDERRLEGGDVVGKGLGSGIHATQGITNRAI